MCKNTLDYYIMMQIPKGCCQALTTFLFSSIHLNLQVCTRIKRYLPLNREKKVLTVTGLFNELRKHAFYSTPEAWRVSRTRVAKNQSNQQPSQIKMTAKHYCR